MTKVKILTDSVVDLPPEYQEKYDIASLPHSLQWEGKTYHDRIDIQPTECYQKIEAGAPIPTTSQVTVGNFLEFFKSQLDQGRPVFYAGISSGISATYFSAQQAKAELGNPDSIAMVDTQTCSLAACFKLLEAAEVADKGGSLQDCVEIVKDAHKRTGTFFTVASLEYLHRGGRINTAKRIFGSMLNIKPVMWMNKDNGKIDLLESVVSRKKAMQRMVELLVKEVDGRKVKRLGIEHALAPDEAAKLEEMALKVVQPAEIIRMELSPVIGSHVGPGTLNLIYICE